VNATTGLHRRFLLIGLTVIFAIFVTLLLYHGRKKDHPTQLPSVEVRFISIVSAAQKDSINAANDMQRGGIKANRDKSLCAGITFPEVKDWIGTVINIDSNSDGKGVLAIQIAPGITVKTWNNALSDIGSGTLIDQTSPVFKSASLMKPGQLVQFSGELFPAGEDACLLESSMTLRGKVESPEFIFKFSSISAYDSSKQHEQNLNDDNVEGIGKWMATSHTAEAITGDIDISSGAITLQGKTYPLKAVRKLVGNELHDSAQMLSKMDSDFPNISGNLFRTAIPSSVQFVNGNTICTSNAEWVLLMTHHGDQGQSDEMRLAFFSGSAEPILETQALGTSNALCGSFYYERTATITSPASTPAQSIPKSLLGSWTVRRELPASTISCWAQDQADKLIVTEIEYSADTLRWRDIGAINPEVEVKTVTANQFMTDNSGSQSYVDFKVLGIQANEATEISLKHTNSKEWEGTSEIPGDNVLIKNPDTIVFSVCNVYFEAERQRR
jgi:hypothetical protein